MTDVVILLGAPGSGKGTQASRLSRALSLPHIATGNLFRENLSQGTPLGERAKAYLEGGTLVPDDLVVDMLFERVQREDCTKGFLLDGFPRTLHQAQVLDDRLPEDAHVFVANLDVDDETIIERAAGRLLCKRCDNIHHAKFQPPAREGVCDACGGELYKREDDSPSVVKKRLSVYHDQTRPLVDFYREQSRLCDVNGKQSPDQVFGSLMGCLGEVA